MATYQVETDHGTYEVETEEPGFDTEKAASNIIPDIKETVANLGEVATGPAMDIMSGNAPAAIPKLLEQGKQFFQAPKENLAAMARPILHPLKYAEEHPVQQAINVASLGTPLVSGAAETAGKYAGRFGENQMGALHGATPAQFRILGREKFGPTMRASFEHGDADFGLGPIGREQAIKERIAGLGNDIGETRAQAASAGPEMTPTQMAAEIRKRALADFSPGGKHFDEAGSFEKNLKNIEDMPQGGIENFAQRASEIKGNATQNKLRLPVNAETNVANQMSAINDAEIAKRLPPELQENYEQLKDEFGVAKNLEPMELRGEGKEALGASSNTAFGTIKKFAHAAIGGPKLGAKVGFGAESALNAFSANEGALSAGGASSGLLHAIHNDPASLGRFAPALQKAYQDGGNEGLAAMHFILGTTQPDYMQDALKNAQ